MSTEYITHVPHGCLKVGAETPLGTIEQVSWTAYRIGGRWVGFEKVHGPRKRAVALAIPQAWVDAVTPEMSARMKMESDAAIAFMVATGV